MTTSAVDPYQSLGLTRPVQQAGKQTLGQADFLKLMTTQLQSQDPFKPMDSAQFLGQIAQFSTVSGIQSLNEGFSSLASGLGASQALQGASLVGRQVQIAGDQVALGAEGGTTASATLGTSGTVTAIVRDASGAVVRRLDLGTRAAGEVAIAWDGLAEDGSRAAAGRYQLSVTRTDASGHGEALATQIQAPVTAVRLSAQGLQLEVEGIGTAALSAVTRIF